MGPLPTRRNPATNSGKTTSVADLWAGPRALISSWYARVTIRMSQRDLWAGSACGGVREELQARGGSAAQQSAAKGWWRSPQFVAEDAVVRDIYSHSFTLYSKVLL